MACLRVSAISICLCAGLVASACGETTTPDEGNELLVAASPLSSQTSVVLFTVSGDGIADGSQPYLGTRGSTPSGTPPASTATFIVPEGFKEVMAFGLSEFTHSDLTGEDVTFYELRDQCSGTTTVQSRTRRSVSVSCSDLGAGTGDVGVDKLILNGDYEFDANAEYAGSFDGSNIARLIIDGEAASANVTLLASAGFACFETLPTVWPDPGSWSGCSGQTNASGDWMAYVVATPGSSGSVVVQNVNIGGGYRYMFLRIGGLARIAAQAE